MFSVDNFYDCFFANYGLEKTKNLVLTFQPHGTKDLHNLEEFGMDSRTIPEFEYKKKIYGKIVMNDQEPFSLDYLDTYRQNISNQKNSIFIANPSQFRKAERISQFPSDITTIEVFRKIVGGERTPIICHSERNSDDISVLESHGFISCYYWWHGLVARDWFRHWQHYTDLLPTDKSNRKCRFLLYSRDHTGTREYRKELVDHCQRHQNQILYNWNNTHVDSTYSAKISVPDAVNSAVHIVAETLFDTSKIYLTEKVFKPMVMSQPFILFAPPGSLQYLRDYGFQTFNDCWDESYDQETDATKRMKLLLDLIDHLAGLSESEFQHIYKKSLPIIEHNRQRFFSSEFQDHLISEMNTNIDRALFEQDQRHQHSLDDKSSANGDDV